MLSKGLLQLARNSLPLLSGGFVAVATMCAVDVVARLIMGLDRASLYEYALAPGALLFPYAACWVARQTSAFRQTGNTVANTGARQFTWGFQIALIIWVMNFFS